MAGPRNSSANKAHVVIEFPEDFSDLMGKINAQLDEESLSIAKDVVTDMKASTAFRDYTGTARESEWHKKHFPNATVLRKKMRAQKSHYVGGGAIAIASAPHAHLVEYGHALILDGKVVGTVPAHPFMRPAKEKRVNEAIERIKEALIRGLAE